MLTIMDDPNAYDRAANFSHMTARHCAAPNVDHLRLHTNVGRSSCDVDNNIGQLIQSVLIQSVYTLYNILFYFVSYFSNYICI